MMPVAYTYTYGEVTC